MKIANIRPLSWDILSGMSADKAVIHVTVSRKFGRCISRKWLIKTVQKVLQSAGLAMTVEIGLVITGDKTIRRLNRIYRGEDETTDVLAFPMSSQEDTHFVQPPDGIRHLGEVIVCYPQATRQCEPHGHTVTEELKLLIVHGVLHLLGYDHETPSEKARMQEKEEEILAKIRGA